MGGDWVTTRTVGAGCTRTTGGDCVTTRAAGAGVTGAACRGGATTRDRSSARRAMGPREAGAEARGSAARSSTSSGSRAGCEGAGANFCPAPDRRSGWPLADSFDPAGEAPDPLLGPDLKNGATTVILPSCGFSCQLRKCRHTRILLFGEPSCTRRARRFTLSSAERVVFLRAVSSSAGFPAPGPVRQLRHFAPIHSSLLRVHPPYNLKHLLTLIRTPVGAAVANLLFEITECE